MHTWGDLDIRARASCAYPSTGPAGHPGPLGHPPSKVDMMYLSDHYPSPYPQYPHDYASSYKCADYTAAMHKDFTRSCAYETMNFMAGHGFEAYDNFSHLRMDPYGRGKSGRAKGRLLLPISLFNHVTSIIPSYLTDVHLFSVIYFESTCKTVC